MMQLVVKLATTLVCVSRYIAVSDGTLKDKWLLVRNQINGYTNMQTHMSVCVNLSETSKRTDILNVCQCSRNVLYIIKWMVEGGYAENCSVWTDECIVRLWWRCLCVCYSSLQKILFCCLLSSSVYSTKRFCILEICHCHYGISGHHSNEFSCFNKFHKCTLCGASPKVYS